MGAVAVQLIEVRSAVGARHTGAGDRALCPPGGARGPGGRAVLSMPHIRITKDGAVPTADQVTKAKSWVYATANAAWPTAPSS